MRMVGNTSGQAHGTSGADLNASRNLRQEVCSFALPLFRHVFLHDFQQ